VELAELALFDRELLASLQRRPYDQLKIFEAAASAALQREVVPAPEETPSGRNVFDVQIALKSTQLATPLRDLTAEHIGKLVKVSGIIVSQCIGVWLGHPTQCCYSQVHPGSNQRLWEFRSSAHDVENATFGIVAVPSHKPLCQHSAAVPLAMTVVQLHTRLCQMIAGASCVVICMSNVLPPQSGI